MTPGDRDGRAPRDWDAFEPVLRSAVDTDLVTLTVLAKDARSQLAEASRLTEYIRREDDAYRTPLVDSAFQDLGRHTAQSPGVKFGATAG